MPAYSFSDKEPEETYGRDSNRHLESFTIIFGEGDTLGFPKPQNCAKFGGQIEKLREKSRTTEGPHRKLGKVN